MLIAEANVNHADLYDQLSFIAALVMVMPIYRVAQWKYKCYNNVQTSKEGKSGISKANRLDRTMCSSRV